MAIGKLLFEEPNLEKNTINLYQTIVLDEKESKKAVISYAKRIAEEMNLSKKAVKELRKMQYHIQDSTSISFDLNTGWFIDSYFERNVIIEESEITHLVEIVCYEFRE